MMGQHLGDELLGAEEDDTVEGISDLREESVVGSRTAQKAKPSMKQGEYDSIGRGKRSLGSFSKNHL